MFNYLSNGMFIRGELLYKKRYLTCPNIYVFLSENDHSFFINIIWYFLSHRLRFDLTSMSYRVIGKDGNIYVRRYFIVSIFAEKVLSLLFVKQRDTMFLFI